MIMTLMFIHTVVMAMIVAMSITIIVAGKICTLPA